MRLLAPLAIAASALTLGPALPRTALAGDPPAKKLPFSDDLPPPPPLPEPLDRRFHAELTTFDGERAGWRWKWTSDQDLEDFDPCVPVRVTVRGEFVRKGDGEIAASGTAGIRLRLAMLSDIKVGVNAVLDDPHDLGVSLTSPETVDESILCLVQDRVFTRFDAAAGNSNMINKLGGVADADRTAKTGGMTEFRYIDRRVQPKLGRGHHVRFDVVRKGVETTFSITPKGEQPTVLKGKDTDAPFDRFQAGLYVAGAKATFGPLDIEGRIDVKWCQENGVLPFVAGNLLHPGNRFKGPEKKAAETVEAFAKQMRDGAPADPKHAIAPETVAALVGDAKLALVIRMRAAEALADAGEAAGGVAANVARLLDAAEQETRILAWRVLRPRLPWHFRYEPDADGPARKEATQLIGAYLREEEDARAQGKVFVEGYWYTPARADQIRASWEKAWDLRTDHIRLRTNLSKEWADWTLAALEAGYREMTRVLGRTPPADKLPMSVFVFAEKDDFQAFCTANGYDDKLAWARFADLDRGVAFDTFERRGMPSWPLGLLAKLQIRATTGMSWPAWFEEGRGSWFANGEYGTSSFDGTTLRTGLPAKAPAIYMLQAAAKDGRLWPLDDFVSKDPRRLASEPRRIWYAHAWALHTFLMDHAPEEDRNRLAEWQAAMQTISPPANETEAMGRRILLALFHRDRAAFEARFAEWVKTCDQ